jgi:integrase
VARPKSQSPPKYRLHKARGLAVVTIDGIDHYLGKYGSAASHEEYARLIAERKLPQATVEPVSMAERAKSTLLIGELTLEYWKHAEVYFNGGGHLPAVKAALQAINRCYANLPAAEFGPLKLEAVRQTLVDRGLSRKYINDLVFTLVRMFRWSVSRELLSKDVYQTLETLESLKKGRSAAREHAPVIPVSEEHVEATLAHSSRVTAAMVRLQLLTGARPGEICALRPRDVTFLPDGLWCYRPVNHKNDHREQDRRIYIGERGQTILRSWLQREAESYCFSPREADEEFRQWKRTNRSTHRQQVRPRSPVQQRRPGNRYTKDSYRRAIERACVRAGVPKWTPHQLRHTAGCTCGFARKRPKAARRVGFRSGGIEARWKT